MKEVHSQDGKIVPSSKNAHARQEAEGQRIEMIAQPGGDGDPMVQIAGYDI